MRVTSLLGLAALIAGADTVLRAQAGPDPAPRFALAEPGISPDGREIAFTARGDIWSVPATGGEARLLVADAAFERRPLFSPDGRSLAFVSMRTGGGDIYVLTLATGLIRRVTWDDGAEQLDGWSRDSAWIYFSSTGRDIAGMNDVFRVRASGGTPMAVTGDRYVNEFGGAPSPDGRRLAFSARGIGSAQWWRKAGSHIDQSELWLIDVDAPPDGGGDPPGYTRLTERDARQLWPMWHPDGRSIFYVSSRGGTDNVWTRPAAASGADRALTRFRDGRVLWPSIALDGRTVAFERGFGIWTLDTTTGQTREVPIALRGAALPPPPERTRQTTQFEDLALAPDGRKLAFVARGDIFAASAREAGDATRVTSTRELESQPVWAPDSRRLAYVSARGAGQQIYLYDVPGATETPLTAGDATDLSPVFSPDGTRLGYLRDRRQLRVIDLATKQDRVLATGVFADTLNRPRPVWSPDGRWLAVFMIGAKAFTNVSLVDVTPAAGGSPPRPVSFLANVFANTIAWSRDGTYLLFDTRQRTEDGRLARVDLTPRTPRFREDLFRDLFTTPPARPGEPRPGEPPTPAVPSDRRGTEPAEPPESTEPRNPRNRVDPVFADIRQRLSLLPTGLDVGAVSISPDGKTALVIAASAGQANLYSWPLDDLAADRPVARQLTTTSGAKSDVQWSPDSREAFYLDAGRIHTVNVASREARPLAVTAEFTSDFTVVRRQVFDQAWTLLRDNFFDPQFNGVDWQASRRTYGERADAATTPDELRRLISLMVGDLNASHLGISAAGAAPAVGRLGLTFDRLEFERQGRLRVTGLVPLGPASLARGIAPGDVITAVNGTAVTAATNLDELLANTIDRRVALTVQGPPAAGAAAGVGTAAGAPREVIVRPTNQATEKSLLYQQWVDQNRKYVLKASGGRLGYVHMINMSAAALDQLYIDLDTENHTLDGVVVDIRNNSGGFVNAYAIDVFTRQPYLRMSTRGVPEAPARTILGQRALESATVLVTNQHSLSDAEDFTEGYRTLKLGPVVGEPTAGWIVYTWDVRLVDGSTLRLPRMRVKGADGADMEWNPRKVDHPVTRPLGETGQDAQLDEAIRVLLRRLGRAE